ncbi:hypothetical protein DFP72DRAFT_1082124 [Ephemerocybe angulata]|uniref:Uncharacterized protein n=1 Tax=Ephemerocybe angulata TaxID=980116 RepID=A0A8H6LSN7_9AGAR|nr:hypothetical protein DFP72DRAFT_1082124 [Tulosesus angulatus]
MLTFKLHRQQYGQAEEASVAVRECSHASPSPPHLDAFVSLPTLVSTLPFPTQDAFQAIEEAPCAIQDRDGRLSLHPQGRLSAGTVSRIKRVCKIRRNPTIAEWLTAQPHHHSRSLRPFNVPRLDEVPLPDPHDDESHPDDEALSTTGPDSKPRTTKFRRIPSLPRPTDAQPGETRGQVPHTDATRNPHPPGPCCKTIPEPNETLSTADASQLSTNHTHPTQAVPEGHRLSSRLFDVRRREGVRFQEQCRMWATGRESGSQNEGSRRLERVWHDDGGQTTLTLDCCCSTLRQQLGYTSKGTFEGPEFPSSGRMDSDSSHGRQKPRPNAVVLEEWSTATKRHPLHALRTVLRARMCAEPLAAAAAEASLIDSMRPSALASFRMVEPRGGWEGRAMVDSSIKTARQSTLSLAALVRNSGSLRSEWKDLPQHSRMP